MKIVDSTVLKFYSVSDVGFMVFYYSVYSIQCSNVITLPPLDANTKLSSLKKR